jgi:hypothetical protein
VRPRGLIGPLAILVAVLLGGGVVALAGGLGGEGEGEDPSDRYLPGSFRSAGAGGGLSQAAQADCNGWRAGTSKQRGRAVEDIEAVFARKLPGGRAKGATLSREEAYAVFERACAERAAGPWRLWKVYEHALAFQYRTPPES